jgi:hypothetical protein
VGKTAGGLNMALKPDFVKNMPDADIVRRVDTAILKASRKLCKDSGKNFRNAYNTSDGWKYGVDTNGLNNISFKRLESMKNSKVFKKTDLTLHEILPVDIANKLKGCKKYCRREYIEDRWI